MGFKVCFMVVVLMYFVMLFGDIRQSSALPTIEPTNSTDNGTSGNNNTANDTDLVIVNTTTPVPEDSNHTDNDTRNAADSMYGYSRTQSWFHLLLFSTIFSAIISML